VEEAKPYDRGKEVAQVRSFKSPVRSITRQNGRFRFRTEIKIRIALDKKVISKSKEFTSKAF